MKIKDIKIRTMMNINFGIIMALFFVLVLVSYFGGNFLLLNTVTIVEHPIIVRQAVDNFALDNVKIYWGIETALEQENYQQMKPFLDIIKNIEADAIINLDLLYTRYLGPKEDLDNLTELFYELKSNRDVVISLIEAGNFEQAAAINNVNPTGLESEHLSKLTAAIEKISLFAENMAEEIYASSKKSAKSIQQSLIILSSVFLILTFFLSYFMIRNIRLPLNELSSAARRFSQGDMNARSTYKNKNEFGALSQTYNTMIEKIKRDIALSVSEVRYRRLFESAQDGILILDADSGKINDVNPFLINLLGYSKNELIEKTVWEIGAFKDIIANKDNFKELQSEKYIRYEDLPLQTKDGKRIEVEFVSNVYSADNKDVIQCNIRDITERVKIEEALKESENRYISYIENAPDGVFITDEKCQYIEVNRAASEMTEFSKNELIKMKISDLLVGDSKAACKNHFTSIIKNGSAKGEFQYRRKNGSIRWWSIDAVKLSEYRILGFAKDITSRKKAEEGLLHLSYYDQLTGIYNRRFFEEELIRLDTKRNLPLSIIMGDINGLKLVNDSFGHANGDEYIKETAKIIKTACRADDIVARLGGDEFVILLPKSDADEAAMLIGRIEKQILKHKVGNINLSVSFGLDTKQNEEQEILGILANAENHMYRHKIHEHSSIRGKTIDIIMNTLFEKSSRESLHSKRVSTICESIASKMNFEKSDVSQIRTAGLVHDIGKIGIDETILNKNGSLSDYEFIEIQKHSEAGWRILSSSIEFSEVAEFVLNHHEKFDGSGYPSGKKGEEIPIESRIIAIANAYDAMTSDRSYRNKISDKEAKKEIKRCCGTQFDPQIAELFINDVFPDNSD